MPGALTTLHRITRKLRGRSLDEVRVRSAQAFNAWRERTGLASGAIAVDDAALARRLVSRQPVDAAALLTGFRSRAPRFFPAFDDPTATVDALAERCPDDRAAVLARAERVLAGQFDVLGYTGLSYGTPIDWQRDPVRDRRAPLVHWSRVPYLDAAAVGDHKVTWEINRQQYLVVLGQAFWYTRDERYARGFAEHVTAWMDANPPKDGINWASSLEVSFRAMSWIWALHFFRDADALTPALYARLLGQLHIHALHIEQNLSTYFSPNTHLTGEALGLVFIGALVPELAGAARWREIGTRIFAEWFPRQVRADGGYFEQATQYHRYTTEFMLQLLVLDARHGWGLEPTLQPVLTRALDYLLAVMRPDGTIPLVGDDDGGKLVDLDGKPPDDVRGVFAQAAVWLGSPTYAYAARPQSAAWPAALWLFGSEAARRLDAIAPEPPVARAQAFPDTGVFVMRDGWSRDASYALIDCGPHGVMNGGHAHADLLSIVISVQGRPVLVDSGTFCYVGLERNAFRRADAHNTLLVDGEGSSTPAADAFQWVRVTDGHALDWSTHSAFTFFEGMHQGFKRFADPVVHRRAVLFLPTFGWLVRDRIEATGAHAIRVLWHVAPDLTVRPENDESCAFDATDGAAVPLRIAAFTSSRSGVRLSVDESWISPRYGARSPATRVAFDQADTGPQELITCALLAGPEARTVQVREVASGTGARVFVIRATLAGDPLTRGAGPVSADAASDVAIVIVGQDAGWTVDLATVARTEIDDVAATSQLPVVRGDHGWAWITGVRTATSGERVWRLGLGPGIHDGAAVAGFTARTWRVAEFTNIGWHTEPVDSLTAGDAT